MAVLTTNMLQSKPEISLASLLRGRIDAWHAWRAAEKARAELFALDDRELNDLGISRYDIRHMTFPRAK
ncbi:DUF1127 domain-containing protein [Poseidonocella sp. HB161398]|uniref:DUF1127 domain-containing protein n=1 Tax=Poseidonocella sp. HB161398 TaxID=2320855 RepID=UPI0011098303|nr:DUF1127 domain-containing protein [Poseidonocella sp. HB161398]